MTSAVFNCLRSDTFNRITEIFESLNFYGQDTLSCPVTFPHCSSHSTVVPAASYNSVTSEGSVSFNQYGIDDIRRKRRVSKLN